MKLPKLIDKGWYKESDPVLCKVEYLDDDKLVECFCVCIYCETDKGTKSWEAQIDHLMASTMPSADYEIIHKSNFKVINWQKIKL